MHETKETNSDQTATVQEKRRLHRQKQHTHALLLEKVSCGLQSRMTSADDKIKLPECIASVYCIMFIQGCRQNIPKCLVAIGKLRCFYARKFLFNLRKVS